ncbi:AAA family ATPase [Halovenus sp. WSH3]|uniref:non-specific serine/threonine protein kinase n=1 Tax=Halovenus carboxidivorans TaxID=2692199 RepID=A0A6B0T6Y9_9EURY|nr:ATPase domain-containing protein [Halovenus carboxidivorans]MXR51333.1 AAA family ATPase [Halovenus carboxidivorans]
MVVPRVSTGVERLDEVLRGGLVGEQCYLLSGDPGAGKTILGIEFLCEGARQGESCLYINLGENFDAIRRSAEQFGFSLEDIEFLDLSPTSDRFTEDDTYSIFSPAEVERETFTAAVTAALDGAEFDRIVVDPITQFRHLTPGEHQFRQQLLSFFEYLTANGATVLFTSQETPERSDLDLQFLSDGTLTLDTSGPVRKLEVTKFRSSGFVDGRHTYRITDGGFELYPRFQSEDAPDTFPEETLSSGISELDALLRGGVERKTSVLLTGPSGVGKTTLGTSFIEAAAERGESSAIYLFDETSDTFRKRSAAVGLDIAEMESAESLSITEIDALDISALEFANHVREEVEQQELSTVLIDGVQGYRQSIVDEPEEDLLTELHRLVRYLKSAGVTVFLTSASSAREMGSPTAFNGSYLVDTIILQQHVETGGELTKTVGVLKKRTGDHLRSFREFEITVDGIDVAESPLDGPTALTAAHEPNQGRSDND